jgi:hypothetical protein
VAVTKGVILRTKRNQAREQNCKEGRCTSVATYLVFIGLKLRVEYHGLLLALGRQLEIRAYLQTSFSISAAPSFPFAE